MIRPVVLIEWVKHHIDYGVFGILGIMSAIMLYKVVERGLFYRCVDLQSYKNIYRLTLDLERGLMPIYTVGATAPYVGLLGTVIGVLITFYDISQADGAVDVGEIMLGLALALKATAAGIAVAIPAMWFYNALTATVEAKKLGWKNVQSQ